MRELLQSELEQRVQVWIDSLPSKGMKMRVCNEDLRHINRIISAFIDEKRDEGVINWNFKHYPRAYFHRKQLQIPSVNWQVK